MQKKTNYNYSRKTYKKVRSRDIICMLQKKSPSPKLSSTFNFEWTAGPRNQIDGAISRIVDGWKELLYLQAWFCKRKGQRSTDSWSLVEGYTTKMRCGWQSNWLAHWIQTSLKREWTTLLTSHPNHMISTHPSEIARSIMASQPKGICGVHTGMSNCDKIYQLGLDTIVLHWTYMNWFPLISINLHSRFARVQACVTYKHASSAPKNSSLLSSPTLKSKWVPHQQISQLCQCPSWTTSPFSCRSPYPSVSVWKPTLHPNWQSSWFVVPQPQVVNLQDTKEMPFPNFHDLPDS